VDCDFCDDVEESECNDCHKGWGGATFWLSARELDVQMGLEKALFGAQK
jgi:hypothetical protein